MEVRTRETLFSARTRQNTAYRNPQRSSKQVKHLKISDDPDRAFAEEPDVRTERCSESLLTIKKVFPHIENPSELCLKTH